MSCIILKPSQKVKQPKYPSTATKCAAAEHYAGMKRDNVRNTSPHGHTSQTSCQAKQARHKKPHIVYDFTEYPE